MKAVRKALLEEPCRSREITDNEREAFSNYSHLQRYFPALDLFKIPDSALSHKHMELPTKYQITQWISQDKPKFWDAMRTVSVPAGADPPDAEACKVFVKVVHLLNPIDIIKEKYVCPEHPLLPQSEKTWKNTLLKLHSHNNQAYVDAVCNYVLSRFRELDLTPHCVLSYGSSTGISEKYQYTITNEYDTYRQCRWFWKGMASHSARLTIVRDNNAAIPDFEEFYKEVTTCPFDDKDESDTELEPIVMADIDDISDMESVHSFTFDTIEDDTDNSSNILQINQSITRKGSCKNRSESKSESESDLSEQSGSDSESESGSDQSGSEFCEFDICLELPNMPIITIAQEAQDGVMDELLEEDTIDGFERETQEWENRWTAWMFQVVAALTFLQSAICFTHNDLHSNNILWRKTDQKYLFYRKRDGTIWRVPTFGKIFTIIDFGRSIFRLGRHLWVSDDHWPEQDAGDQYNFGPFFDHSKPKVPPNPSFDLCRLAVSLIDGLFDEPPPKKKGKGVPVMSQEGSWKVYETRSPLYNLLWSWTVNDKGETIYETEDGEEKYDGFDLYIRIAQDVHGAVPQEQLHRPIFQQFVWKNKVSSEDKIYSLGV